MTMACHNFDTKGVHYLGMSKPMTQYRVFRCTMLRQCHILKTVLCGIAEEKREGGRRSETTIIGKTSNQSNRVTYRRRNTLGYSRIF